MSHRYCCIVSAGTFDKESFFCPEGSCLYAADGGYKYLDELNEKPDIVLGDFDSLNYTPKIEKERIITLPCEKDDTDTLYAVKHALSLGCDRFLIYGALGGDRIDHTIANLQTLSFIANQNAQGFIISKNTVITAIKNKSISFKETSSGMISVFAMGKDARNVTIQGLKYNIENATLTNDFPIGVSNEFVGEKATVSVQNGTLTIVFSGKYTDLIDL